MKYEVIGWTDDYGTFKDMPIYYDKAYIALLNKIRKDGLEITGFDHQENGYIPVFNTGETMRFSQRAWGQVMADALHVACRDGFEYAIFGVSASIYNENPNILSDHIEAGIDYLNMDSICDTFEVIITNEEYEGYKEGKKIFNFYFNLELRTAEIHDRIILTTAEHTLKTELMYVFSSNEDYVDYKNNINSVTYYEEPSDNKSLDKQPENNNNKMGLLLEYCTNYTEPVIVAAYNFVEEVSQDDDLYVTEDGHYFASGKDMKDGWYYEEEVKKLFRRFIYIIEPVSRTNKNERKAYVLKVLEEK